MIGGGGEKVTLRIAAQHADHWNVWGGPATFAHKGRILEEHCAKVGRDPKQILRSSVMVLAFADDRAGVERMEQTYMKRMGADAQKARDTVLGGSVAEIKDKLAKLAATGVGMLFIPTFFLPADRYATLDRFMSEIAPAFRS
jgi:alkanesulfonate monooxygenase SsuD/methylene tetrahydromethanopterin reductase-like flavin-dependent oxidoreductase (luciferase family)